MPSARGKLAIASDGRNGLKNLKAHFSNTINSNKQQYFPV